MFSFLKKLDKRQRFIVFTCFFAFFVNGQVSLMMGSFVPDLQANYGISGTVSGLLISAHSIGNLIAGFVSGLVPLLLGRKRSIICLHTLTFVGYAMIILFGNPVLLFLAFLLVGFGRGSVTNFNSRQINLLSDGSPAASNIMHAVFAIGAIIAPMVFLVLKRWIGWQAGLVWVILFGCVSLSNMMRMDLGADDKPERADRTNRTLKFLKNPSFLIFCGMMFCYLCSEYSLNGWLVTYIQNKENLVQALAESGTDTAAFSQSMATLLWSVMLVGRLFCAALSGRVSQKMMMLVASAGMAAFFAMLLLADSIPLVVAAVACMGFSMAGICPMIYSDAAVFTNAYPMATSMILGIGSIGGIVMPTLVGSLADAYGFNSGMGAILVMVVLLVIFALLNVAVKTRYMPEMKRPEK